MKIIQNELLLIPRIYANQFADLRIRDRNFFFRYYQRFQIIGLRMNKFSKILNAENIFSIRKSRYSFDSKLNSFSMRMSSSIRIVIWIPLESDFLFCCSQSNILDFFDLDLRTFAVFHDQ